MVPGCSALHWRHTSWHLQLEARVQFLLRVLCWVPHPKR